jgi:tetratricopeptide (TPR) repeat protein
MFYRQNFNNQEIIMIKSLIYFTIMLISIFFFSSCKKDPNSSVINGTDKFYHNDYRGALQDLNKAIEQYPDNSQAYYIRGNIKYALKDYVGAIQDFNVESELNPNDVVIYSARGKAKMKLGDYSGALKDYNKSINVFPVFASEAYFNRGVVKDSLKDFAGAKLDYVKSKELFQDDILAYYNLGRRVYDEDKDYLKSIHYFDFAIDTNPRDDSSYFYRGKARFELNDKSGACSDWTKAAFLGISQANDLLKQYCK